MAASTVSVEHSTTSAGSHRVRAAESRRGAPGADRSIARVYRAAGGTPASVQLASLARMRTHGLGLMAAALIAAVFAVYAQVRSHEFVDFDDPVYLAEIRPGLSREGLATAWSDAIFANWIPVTTTSLLFDHELYGEAPAGYLLTNVALHATSTALLFWVLAAATGSLWPSAFVAAVFGLHPLHVESVAWFSQRKDVLCALFWILALTAHVRYARRPSATRYALLLLCAALGSLSKPMMVTLPFTLLLLDYWPLACRSARRRRSPTPCSRSSRCSRWRPW